jgi:hypothetical protein
MLLLRLKPRVERNSAGSSYEMRIVRANSSPRFIDCIETTQIQMNCIFHSCTTISHRRLIGPPDVSQLEVLQPCSNISGPKTITNPIGEDRRGHSFNFGFAKRGGMDARHHGIVLTLFDSARRLSFNGLYRYLITDRHMLCANVLVMRSPVSH